MRIVVALALSCLMTGTATAAPKCRIEQRVIAWSADDTAALLFQHQTCVPHLPPVSLWRLVPGEGRVGERVEIWRPATLNGAVRARADGVVAASRILDTPLDRGSALPGVLVPHPDPEQRDRGLMGSPFLSDSSSFSPYDAAPEVAGERCAASFPCGGLCFYEGHFSPGRRWLVCAPAGIDGAEVPLRYARILPGDVEGGAPALDLEKELGRWNGRILKQRNALRTAGAEPPVPEIAGILRSQNEGLHRLAAQALGRRSEREAVVALLDLLERGSLVDVVPALLIESSSKHLAEVVAERLDRIALPEVLFAEGLLSVAASRCSDEVWAAARRFVTVGGLPVNVRVRLVEGCDRHVPDEDADFVMGLATSEATPLPLRVAAGRVLGRMRGETPNRLKSKLWRYDPPEEVMEAIRGKR